MPGAHVIKGRGSISDAVQNLFTERKRPIVWLVQKLVGRTSSSLKRKKGAKAEVIEFILSSRNDRGNKHGHGKCLQLFEPHKCP